jgi:SAM-dependent methyltransferase
MGVDREAWARELPLSAFVNACYQFHDVASLPRCRSVLVVGPGQGLVVPILRWRGYAVETFDIDSTFAPDHLGSVHDLSQFSKGQFDVIIASHVLEHLAEPYLDSALSEMARVGRHSLIYLPVAGRYASLRVQPGTLNIDWQLRFNLFNYFERPDGLTRKYSGGEHYWEIGRRGFRVRDIKQRLERFFVIVRAYRNLDWLPSYNFVVRSRQHSGSSGSS